MASASEKSVDYLVRLAAERTPAVSTDAIRVWAKTVPARMVSEKIDWLKTLPVEVSAELDDGIYVLGAAVVKVQHAVHGSGRQYAKQLDPETGKFEFVSGLVNQVRAHGRKMTMADAEQFGAVYGRCSVCGRTLTDEDSVANGIGPVCSGKLTGAAA